MTRRARSEASDQTRIALLRGINVGGKNKLAMSILREIFEEIGCRAVTSYIQSGNVVFRADPELAVGVSPLISRALRERFGLAVPLVTRTLRDWRAMVAANPFLTANRDPKKLHVAFLAQAPDASRVATLDPDRSPPDELSVRGAEVYLYCPNGMARSKLTTTYLDSRLQTTSTVRNWNTILALLSLAESADAT
ncbi:MAG: DUF1697 domain-containing protein [Myxococcales bacterium]|nr:DUF1697 domain-containing protein [Myxococcales bacterium]